MADTTPMRHAKYNERVLRARSTNKLNSIPSGKLAEKASPAPRSGSVVKERPARLLNSKSLLNKRPREPEPEPLPVAPMPLPCWANFLIHWPINFSYWLPWLL